MLAKLISAAPLGLKALKVEVEVDIASKSLFKFIIVGLPSKAVGEAKERVIAALRNSQMTIPRHKIVVNLAPADFPKEGLALDLPMAVGILIASGQIPSVSRPSLFLGELSLTGQLRPIRGILPALMMAKKQKIKDVYLPYANRHEAALVTGLNIFPLKSITDYILHCRQIKPIKPQKPSKLKLNQIDHYPIDLADISGQSLAKRALMIAAAGGHNLFLQGQPGVGKSMLAKSLPSILPPLSYQEVLVLAQIYSIAGLLNPSDRLLSLTRPFRSPHHTISKIGMIGGGSNPKPGEVTLAHFGVLFIDEAPEMPRSVLEALRQPLEDGYITITRVKRSINLPTSFILVLAANPCPCGYYGSDTKPCQCTPYQVQKYQTKLSGPLLDRIDLYTHVGAVKIHKLKSKAKSLSSQQARQMVILARQRQYRRYRTRFLLNGRLSVRQLKQLDNMNQAAMALLYQAVEKYKLSTRAFFKLQKVAMTIADLEASEVVKPEHMMEALQFRYRQVDLI